jgi:excisionase family DNA binding protein
MSQPRSVDVRLLSVSEAARVLGVSAWHVRRLVWRGDLPAVRLGRLVRLDRDDLNIYINERKTVSGGQI